MKPTCPHCLRPKTILFYSTVCDICETPPKGLFYIGYIAYNEGDEGRPMYYVWSEVEGAEGWGLKYHTPRTIRAVLSPTPFLWELFPTQAGAFHTDDLYEIYPNHKYIRGEGRAFLAPSSVPLDAQGKVYL